MMMNVASKGLCAAVLSTFVASGCAGQPDRPARNPQDARSELEALMQAHDAAWNAHDPDAMVALFSPAGTLVTPTGARVQGHEALRRVFASPGPTKQTSSKSQIETIQWLDDKVALIDATQTLSGPGVEVIRASRAATVLIAELRDGEWKIVAARPYLFTSPVGGE